MKMMIVIVRDHDADNLTQELTAGNFRVTRVASTSGLLRSGVVTLLMGLEDDQVHKVIQLMHAKLPRSSNERRATLFVVPVDHYEQI